MKTLNRCTCEHILLHGAQQVRSSFITMKFLLSVFAYICICIFNFIKGSQVEGLTENVYNCSGKYYSVCLDDKLPTKYPETKGELMEICDPAIEFLGCVKDFAETCNVEVGFPSAAKDYLALIEEVCDENKPLHAAIVENLRCFNEFQQQQRGNCYMITLPSEKVQEYAEYLMEEGLEINATDARTQECIRTTFKHACEALQVLEKCGTPGMDTYLEVIDRLSPNGLNYGCDQMTKYLGPLVRLLKMEMETENTTRIFFHNRD